MWSLYWEYYVMGIVLLPAIIFSIIAQAKVNGAFKKYSQVKSQSRMTAKQVAEMVLEKEGITDVVVVKTGGHLTDYYSDKDKQVALSEDVCDSTSVASIGIALHEVGHAMQYAKGYKPVVMRNFMVKVCNLSSTLLWPLVIIGLCFNLLVVNGGLVGNICLWAGIGFFGFSVILNLVTLPVEYNASNRAKAVMTEQNILTAEEKSQASKVLNAAALTYVAALLVSMLNFVRFLLVVLSNRKKD